MGMRVRKAVGDIARNVFFGIQVSYRASRAFFIMKSAILAADTAIPIITLYLWSVILNGITERKGMQGIWKALAIYLFLTAVSYLTAKIDEYVSDRYYDARAFYIADMMIEKTARVDMARFESSSFRDRLQNARNSEGALHDTAWTVFDIIADLVNVIAAFVVISCYRVWLGLAIIALLVPYCIYNQHHTEKLRRMDKEQVTDRRMREYYRGILRDGPAQFESKLNRTGPYFMEKADAIWKRLFLINSKERLCHTGRSLPLIILSLLGVALAVLVSVADVLSRTIGVGDLQYHINIAGRLQSQALKLMDDINRFLADNHQISELQEFLRDEPGIEGRGTKKPAAAPRIEFSRVSFRYPDAEDYVLKECSFVIEPYEKIGLLGYNGAGKSTIVKLMLRFYDPEEGCILLDGTDIREYDVYAVRKVFGALFQDYVPYCLPLREIIALSDFGKRFDDRRLQTACDISGVTEIIQNWEKGFDSVLGRHYADDGKDFSGGQWQLVGLARAYFRDCRLMVLDEPSAALDPISEDRIFEQLYHLSRGKGVVTITHRLSNTVLADRILVVGDGHIAEQGTHAELLEKDGIYARLFRLQAEKYT